MKRADQRYLGRGSPPHDVQFVGSRGSYVQGADGRRYVDFIAGWCVGNLGWGVPAGAPAGGACGQGEGARARH